MGTRRKDAVKDHYFQDWLMQGFTDDQEPQGYTALILTKHGEKNDIYGVVFCGGKYPSIFTFFLTDLEVSVLEYFQMLLLFSQNIKYALRHRIQLLSKKIEYHGKVGLFPQFHSKRLTFIDYRFSGHIVKDFKYLFVYFYTILASSS